MVFARPRRRKSGATVMAVTWPCQSLYSPSVLPTTGLVGGDVSFE